MKKYILLFASLLPFAAIAQTTVILRQALASQVNSIPVCQTSKASYTSCFENGVCDGGKALSAFSSNFSALTQSRIQAPDAAQQQAQNDLATQMQDPAFQEKIKNMSVDEQIKFAQQASAQATGATRPTSGVPNEIESAIIRELGTLAADEGTFSTKLASDFAKLLETYDAKYVKLRADLETELKACPQLDGGEGDGGPDPKCAIPLKNSYGQKMVATTNQLISEANTMFGNYRVQLKNRYAKIESLIAQSGYGDNIKLQGPYDSACSGQGYVISAVMALGQCTEKLFEYACNHQAEADPLLNAN